MFLVRLSPREALHMANPLYQILVPLGGWMNPSTQTANLGRLHRSSPPFQARSPRRTRSGSGRIEAQKRSLSGRKVDPLQAGFSAMVDPRPLSTSKSSQSHRPGPVKRAQKSLSLVFRSGGIFLGPGAKLFVSAGPSFFSGPSRTRTPGPPVLLRCLHPPSLSHPW